MKAAKIEQSKGGKSDKSVSGFCQLPKVPLTTPKKGSSEAATRRWDMLWAPPAPPLLIKNISHHLDGSQPTWAARRKLREVSHREREREVSERQTAPPLPIHPPTHRPALSLSLPGDCGKMKWSYLSAIAAVARLGAADVRWEEGGEGGGSIVKVPKRSQNKTDDDFCANQITYFPTAISSFA